MSAERPPILRFAEIRFDPRSGEIERRAGGRVVHARLGPQPARLLAHLVARRPELVGGEEIRRLLWPDVQVEYEQSLHTCIRQIRAALGDSAAEPRYIETIPRRGYRFLVESQGGEETRADGPQAAAVNVASAPPVERAALAGGRRWPPGMPSTLVLVLLLVLSLGAASLRLGAGAASPPVRVAVMPFEPLAGGSALAPGNGLGEAIVERLVADRASPLAVVGPTTTALYAGRPDGVRRLIAELGIDYVVNGREIVGAPASRLLVEIIRADGAHVWAKYLDEFPPAVPPAATIREALDRELL